MKHLLARLLIIFSVCIISCAEPVGSIAGGGGSGSGGYGGSDSNGGSSRGQSDFIMLRPKRILYDANSTTDGKFDRNTDLSVFITDENGYRMLDTNDPGLLLEIIMNYGFAGESTVVIDTIFPFSIPGRHVVRGTYGGKTDEYSIEVRGSFVDPGDGSGIVDIVWQ